MYPHVVYNSATPTGLGWFGANHLQFFNPYRVGSDWFPIQRLMPSPLLPTAYCLLPTAYGVGLVWCRSSTILQPLQGWVMYPHVVYNSATPTGLGHVSTCCLQFCNPYGVGLVWCQSSTILQSLQGWVMYPHVVYNSSTPTGLGLVSTCRLQFFNPYGVGLVWCRSSTILQPLQGWVLYPHVVYNSSTPTGLGQVGFPSNA